MFARIAISASLALGIAWSAHADDFIGGDGGSPFGEVNCPNGTALLGLTGRSGIVIDNMHLICGKGRGSPEDNFILDRQIGPSNGGGPAGSSVLTLTQSHRSKSTPASFRGTLS